VPDARLAISLGVTDALRQKAPETRARESSTRPPTREPSCGSGMARRDLTRERQRRFQPSAATHFALARQRDIALCVAFAVCISIARGAERKCPRSSASMPHRTGSRRGSASIGSGDAQRFQLQRSDAHRASTGRLHFQLTWHLDDLCELYCHLTCHDPCLRCRTGGHRACDARGSPL